METAHITPVQPENVNGASPAAEEWPPRRSAAHETCKQASARTGISYWVLYRLAQASAFGPPALVGNAHYFSRRVIDAVVAPYRARAEHREKAG